MAKQGKGDKKAKKKSTSATSGSSTKKLKKDKIKSKKRDKSKKIKAEEKDKVDDGGASRTGAKLTKLPTGTTKKKKKKKNKNLVNQNVEEGSASSEQSNTDDIAGKTNSKTVATNAGKNKAKGKKTGKRKRETTEVTPDGEEITEASVITDAIVKKSKKERGKRKRSRRKKSTENAVEGKETTAVVDPLADAMGEASTAKSLDSPDQATVYVDGIPFSATSDDLRTFFDGCGEISEIRFPLWQDTGRSRGYAHVAFKSAKGFRKALARSGDYLGSRYLRVAASNPRVQHVGRPPKGAPAKDCKTIFVKNLPYDTSEDAVRSAFAQYGEVEDVRLAMWNHTQRRKGFGYVDFAAAKSAQKACEGTTTVGGRRLQVDYEVGKPRNSFKTGDGRNWVKIHGDSTADRRK